MNASIDSTEDNYLETNNIGLQGTHCISGSCLGVCVAIGDNTIFGRIAKLTSDPKTGMTPLQKEILRFVLIISVFITCVVVLIIVLWYVPADIALSPQHTDELKGCLVAESSSYMDRCAAPDCQLRVLRRGFHT